MSRWFQGIALVAGFTAAAAVGFVGMAALERAVLPAPSVPSPEPPVSADEALTAVQARVVSLREQLADATARLDEAKSQRAGARQASDALVDAVDALEGEVGRLHADLDEATGARDILVAELTQTAQALTEHRRELTTARADVGAWRDSAVDAAWRTLVADARDRLCDRGSPRRHARCREAVEEALDAELRHAVAACVTDRGAMPVLARTAGGVPDAGRSLDLPGRWGGDDWYVQLCDPTLPET